MNVTLSDQNIHGSMYPNGTWKSQNFCNNSTRVGYQVTWYENGQMKSAGDFNKGKPVGLHTLWFENGNKRAEINYKDGKRNGDFVFWHSNTQVRLQGSYSSGEVIGVWTKYYPSGQKYRQTDTIKGERLYWHENGQISSRLWRIYYGYSSENCDYYSPVGIWNARGKQIDSTIASLIELKKYKTNTIEREAYSATEQYTSFNKDGVKVHDLDCHWEWESSIHCDENNNNCQEKDYLVTLNKFYDTDGNVDVSTKLYLDVDGEIDGKLYALCFYNSKDSLIYKYIINPETYKDISPYAELLKVDNDELNNLLLKHESIKQFFTSSDYKQYVVGW